MKTDTMKTENINLFVLNLIVIGAIILAFALFGCSSGNSADTTASGTIDGAALYSSDCSGCHGSLATSGKKGASISQIQNAIAHNMGGMGAYGSLTAEQLQAIVSALTTVGTTNPTNTTNAVDTPTSSTASLDGAALYTEKCSGCHGPLATSGKAGAMVSAIQAAIANNKGGMSQFSNLTTAQLQAIAESLATTPASTPTPTPTLTDGASLYATYCSSCHGALATSSKKGRTAAQILSGIGSVNAMGSLSNLTIAQIQAIATALGSAPAQTPTPTPTPTTNDGATLYATNCSSCHGALASSTKRGATASQIQTGISSVGAMSSLSNLSATQIQAIASALATTPAPTPTPTPTPTDGATLYAANCSSCHGALPTSSKAGRTASQIQAAIGSVGAMSSLSNLSTTQIQAIATALATAPTPAPTDGAALYTSYCSSCHGALASSSVRGASASTISSALSSVSQMRAISLTSTQIQAISTALGTTGTQSPTPTPTPAPTDGAALYTTYCSSCHGTLAASAKAGRTATQIQTAIGSVGAMSSLSNLSTTQIQAIATALATAPTPAPTDGAALYTSYCSSCHGALASSSVRGASASTISSALSSVSQMRAISLTSTQIQAISTALGTTGTQSPTPTPTPAPTDGAALYTTYCSSCHGTLAASAKAGRTATQIQTAIGSVSQMSSLSVLTAAQIQSIATALATAPTPAPTDGAALYTSYCSSCHSALASSSVRGASASTISSALSSVSQMSSISLTTTQIQAIATALGTTAGPTPTPTPTCGSCHSIPPATGHHSLHVNSEGLSCSTCHGTGYSKTTVNTATHNNGVINIASGSTPGWNPTTRSCSNSCHGSHTW